MLYNGYCLQWNSLTAVIILENNHRFVKDPDYGLLLERIAKGEATEKDFKLINSRVMTKSDNTIKDLIDPCYACAKNTERNSIASDVFQQRVKTTHTNPWKPPKHTIIIESTISKQSNMKNRQGKSFHSSIYNNCGDADVTSSYNNKHVDPVLKVYKNCPMMLNSNKNMEKNGGGNGTPVKFKRIVLKKHATLNSKNWDSIPINSISEDNTEYMEVEHWEGSFDKNNNYIPPRSFRIYPEVTKVDINMKMHGLKEKCVFKNYYVRQHGLLVNIATTGHKLQGMSKDNVIILSWFYGVKNWVYADLPRVRTLSGLYLFKPLDPKNIINRTKN